MRDAPRQMSAEHLLGVRELLDLSDEQVTQLEELRVAALEQRQAQSARMLDLQSRLRAGDLEPEEWRELMAERGAPNRATNARDHEQVRAILTEEQEARLNTMRAQRAGPRRGVPRDGRSAAGGLRNNRFSGGSFQRLRGAGDFPCRGPGCRPIR